MFLVLTSTMGCMTNVAKYWDGQAATFDDTPDHGLRDPVVRAAWASLLLPRLSQAPGRVADMGCGTGSLSVLLGEQGYQVSGIDLSPRMVALARAKAACAGVIADFEVADAAAPPWPPGSFDVVISRHVLWALPDAGPGLDRWLELLRPDGQLVPIEGKWWTGGGLNAGDALALLQARGREATVTLLTHPAYWGGPITDERYLLVSAPTV